MLEAIQFAMECIGQHIDEHGDEDQVLHLAWNALNSLLDLSLYLEDM